MTLTLTSSDYPQIKNLREKGKSWKEIADLYHTNSGTLYDLVKQISPISPSEIKRHPEVIIQTHKGELKGIRCDPAFLCPICNKRPRGSQKYCSPECARKRNKKAFSKTGTRTVCLFCRGELTSGGKYCSKKCEELNRMRNPRNRLKKGTKIIQEVITINAEQMNDGVRTLLKLATETLEKKEEGK